MHAKRISPDAVIKEKPSPHYCGNRTGCTNPTNMRHIKPSQTLFFLKISVFSSSSEETFIILVIHHTKTVKSNTMANTNTNDEVQKHVATITLSKLVPSEYRMWVIQAEVTLRVYKCLEIVCGNEQNPTPQLNANGNLPVINVALCARINDWNHRHVRAREALLKCLNSADLMKVYSVRESASAIWTQLHEEYSQILDLEYIRVDNEYHLLRKAPETSMDDHINQFTRLRQEVDYHKPLNAQSLSRANRVIQSSCCILTSRYFIHGFQVGPVQCKSNNDTLESWFTCSPLSEIHSKLLHYLQTILDSYTSIRLCRCSLWIRSKQSNIIYRLCFHM